MYERGARAIFIYGGRNVIYYGQGTGRSLQTKNKLEG
jgi:hypothetical protein